MGVWDVLCVAVNTFFYLHAGYERYSITEVWPLVRIYRGGFLLVEFLFLLGINTYGWRQAGVNHVLIFELNPRNNLSHQHLFEVRIHAHFFTRASNIKYKWRAMLLYWDRKNIVIFLP